jgi:hypothetical protein
MQTQRFFVTWRHSDVLGGGGGRFRPAAWSQHLGGLVLLWTARRMASMDGIAVLSCQSDALLPLGDRSGFGAGGTGGGNLSMLRISIESRNDA